MKGQREGGERKYVQAEREYGYMVRKWTGGVIP